MSRRAFVKVLKLLPKLTEREKLAVLFELEVDNDVRNGKGELMEMECGLFNDRKNVEGKYKEGTD